MEQNNQNQEKQDINPNILENKIKSGNFSWAEASAYNKMVWNKTAARDLALSSKEAISSWNLKTTINPQEARIVQKSWVIGEEIKQWNVRADVTDTTPEKFTQEFKQTPTPKVPKLAPDMTKTAEELWLWWKTPESATITPREEAPVDFTKIQTVADWKKQTWWWIDNLDSWIEAKYWTIANKNPDWSLTATINGQDYNWIIDDAGNPIRTQLPPSSASIFDSLKTWVEISQDIQNTNEYKKALQRYQAYNQYANLNANQLASAISSWDLLPWTQVYKDLEANPETKIELNKAQSLNIINWKTVDTTNAWINLTNKITNDSTIANYMSDNNISSDEFNSMVNTPDVVEKAKEVEQYAMKVNDLKATYEDIRRQTEEQFKWTGATKVAIEALIAQRQKDILPALNLAISNYNTSFWTYTDLKNSAIDLFKTNLGLYQQAQAQQQAQQATQTQYDNQVKLLQLQQQYKDIPTSIITDAATGQQQLINTQTWDVIASYDTGLSTTTSKPTLQNFGTSDKPDWRQYNSTTWQWETPSWLTTWTTWETFTGSLTDFIKQSEWFVNVTYDDATWQVLSPWMTAKWTPTIWYGFTSVAWQPVTAWMEILQNGDIIKNWQVISNVDTELQNQIARHSNYANLVKVPLTEAQKTALTSFEYNLWPNIWKWDWKDIIDKINAWDLQWAAEEMKLFTHANWEFMQWLANRRNQEANLLLQGQTEEYSQEAKDWGQNILKWIWGAKLSSIEDKDLRNEVSSYLANAKVSLKPWDPMYEKIKEQKDAIDSLIKNESLAEDVSGWFQISPWDSFTGKKQQYLRKIQYTLDWEVLQNLINVKNQWATFGALSDREWALLQKSASLLNSAANRDEQGNITWFTMSEKDFKQALKDLQTTLGKALEPTKWWDTTNNDPLNLWIEWNNDPLNLWL